MPATWMSQPMGCFVSCSVARLLRLSLRAYTQPGSDYSYSNVLFAEVDARIVGMASGFTGRQHREFSSKPLKQAAGLRVVRMMAVKTLLAPMMRILDTLDVRDFYLMSIATDKEQRGRGVGSMLLDAMEERGKKSGCAHFSLDVSGSNQGARRLYEHRGMTVVSRWPKRLPIPSLTLLRMTKPLSPTEAAKPVSEAG